MLILSLYFFGTRHVTFLCGKGGVYALGAVAANYRGDQYKGDLYLNHFLEVPAQSYYDFVFFPLIRGKISLPNMFF